MNKYAYIINDRVSYIVDTVISDRKLKKKKIETLVEITGLDPMPEVGWRYNTSDKTFLPQEEMTEAEFKEFDDQITKEAVESETYAECRKAAYPKIEHQLEMIYKVLKSLKNQGINLGEDGDNLINSIDKVKKEYPKESFKLIFPKR